MTDHLITPTSELIHQWHREACRDPYNGGAFFRSKTLEYIATQAANWGWQQRDASVADELQRARDEELDACCEWLAHELRYEGQSLQWADDLRAARRPKPKSLAEDALVALKRQSTRSVPSLAATEDCYTILRALERLQELEGQE